MKTRLLGAAGAALIVLTGVPAQAQEIVYDPMAYARMIEDALTALQQLEALKKQIEQGDELFDSLNQLSDVNALAGQLGLPEVRNPLPDMAALRAAADGDLSALGTLAERAEQQRMENTQLAAAITEMSSSAQEVASNTHDCATT
ncbi:MAG: type IV secretion system protein, partial [Phenylobacterium sp.]|nr:type IV secretion system protein [Phenylobacterium sp.]